MGLHIGLVDVDGLGQVRKKGGSYFPNLALMKISAWHKSNGDAVSWANPMEHYDILYMSKVFNYTDDDLYIYDADKVIKGGTGYDIHSTLPEEIDRIQPDYSIYPNVDKRTAYGFLTRGCPNKCKWCVVPKKEGAIRPYMDIDEIAVDGRKNIVLMDNNILAAGDYAVEQLKKIAKRGYRIDFNQALDARFVTDEYAELLARCKWINSTIRLGCDTKSQIKDCEIAMDKLIAHGYTGQFVLYTIIQGVLEETYERIKYWKSDKWKSKVRCQGQPYLDPCKRNTPPQWQKDLASWTNKRMVYASCDFKDFSPRNGFYCREYF